MFDIYTDFTGDTAKLQIYVNTPNGTEFACKIVKASVYFVSKIRPAGHYRSKADDTGTRFEHAYCNRHSERSHAAFR